jgi:hypothetical protein
MLNSFSRSGETALLRALAAHPMIRVVHDLAARNTDEERALASRIRFQGDNLIAADDPLLLGREFPPGSVIVLKNAIWRPRFPCPGFILSRNPFSVVMSVGAFDCRDEEEKERKDHWAHFKRWVKKEEYVPPPVVVDVREKIERWSRHIDKGLKLYLNRADPTTSVAILYARKMLLAHDLGQPILRYETFVKDPEPPLRKLLAYMDLPWSDRVLKSHEDYPEGQVGHGGIRLWEPIHDKSQDKYRTMAPEDFDRLYALTAPALEKFGYAVGPERSVLVRPEFDDRFPALSEAPAPALAAGEV